VVLVTRAYCGYLAGLLTCAGPSASGKGWVSDRAADVPVVITGTAGWWRKETGWR